MGPSFSQGPKNARKKNALVSPKGDTSIVYMSDINGKQYIKEPAVGTPLVIFENIHDLQ